MNVTEVFTSRGDNIIFEDDGLQIATDGATLTKNDASTLKIIPGEKRFHVTVVDDLGQSVKPLFSVANIEPSHNTSHLKVSAFAQEKIELKGDHGVNTTHFTDLFFPGTGT